MARFWHALARRKFVDSIVEEETRLARVLNTVDLTFLGVGSTLGVGVYVLAGNVSKNIAGPAVVLSFLIAAAASVIAGLCYAEFGARVPKAGSAYIYSYVTVGEFIAFIIGWNLILEYVIGSASVARGLSTYLDSMMNDTLKHAFRYAAPMDVSFLSTYFDFLAFFVSVALAVALAFGVKESSLMNNFLTTVNIVVVLFVIVAGSLEADIKNWSIPKEKIPPTVRGGEGGFFPFGVLGAIKGAATCFYGFVGFDCVATTGEEVKNPQRAIPIAIISSLVIIFLSYFGVSTVLTMMWPYYLQDEDAPIPYVFSMVGWPVAQWTVAVGGVFGLCASLFGAMFPLPRIIYAMSSDGLLFGFLGKIDPHYQTPLVGTIFAGVLTGTMAALFELEQLVNMMSIGTLLAYTIVAACVLLLRYKDGADTDDEAERPPYLESTNLVTLKEKNSLKSILKQLVNQDKHKFPTSLSSTIVTVEVFLFCILCILLTLLMVHLETALFSGHPWTVATAAIIGTTLVLILLSIYCQPSSSRVLAFKVPLVPAIPALSILVNIYLMVMLDGNTWIRFAIWMVLGLSIYFGYSIVHSIERKYSHVSFQSHSSVPYTKKLSYSSDE